MIESIEKITDAIFRIPTSYRKGMRVPGIIIASDELMDSSFDDNAIEQVVNVAHIPGIVKASLAMPDIHWGYGFPIGGVAATDLESGVVSPGGVGYDISCGVRLLRTDLEANEVAKNIPELMHGLSRNIPKGLGRKGRIALSPKDMEAVLKSGCRWAISKGYGWQEDLETIEQGGTYDGADPNLVSDQAKKRGKDQLGTIGSGNHFVEIQRVDVIYDEIRAQIFGVHEGQLVIMVHSGSRGLGHQVCGDYIKETQKATSRLKIEIPDRQLACAPLNDPVGRDYLAAMAAAANYGLANRQCIAHWVRDTFERHFKKGARKLGMDLVYDVSHNIAQIEEHSVEGSKRRLCVHRKGATRAFGPGSKAVNERYRDVGQPVIVPGDMGRASYLLSGTKEAMELTFGSTCHGAGRLLSRKAAKKQISGADLEKELEEAGIVVEAGSMAGLAEEAPLAYKDVDLVIDACVKAGISKKVAKLRPLGVLKG